MVATVEESPDQLLIDVKQAAKLLSLSPATIYRLCDRGAMPRPLKIGHLIRWEKSSLHAWIAEGCKANRPAGKRG